MNNASSSIFHPQRNDTHQQQRQATSIDNIHGSTATGEEEEEHVPTSEDNRDDPVLRKRRIRRDQKIQFFDHLIRNLDMVVYCQLSILYYMEYVNPPFALSNSIRQTPSGLTCPYISISLLALLIRVVFHYILLTPKPPLPPPFQPFPPSPPPSFSLISLTNLIPFLMHTFTRSPSASEAARGYLHGGILIDFVGQAPVSKLRLVVLDFVVFGLQLVMMTLVLERRELGPPAGTPTDGYAPPTSPRRRIGTQDHDAEERGVLLPSSASSAIAELDDRQTSFRGGRTEGAAQDRDSLDDDNSNSDSPVATNEQHALDGFHSGQYVVANLHLMSTIRDEWMRHSRDAASSGSAASGTETRTGMGPPGTGTTTRRRITVHRGVRRMGRRGRGGGEWGARLGFAVGTGLAGWR